MNFLLHSKEPLCWTFLLAPHPLLKGATSCRNWHLRSDNELARQVVLLAGLLRAHRRVLAARLSVCGGPRRAKHGMLADADSGLATCSDLPSCSEVLCPVQRAAPPTLRQHYYPEGGWGWLVVAVAVAVQVLAHGLHMAVGVWMPEAQKHFHTSQMAPGTSAEYISGPSGSYSKQPLTKCGKRNT